MRMRARCCRSGIRISVKRLSCHLVSQGDAGAQPTERTLPPEVERLARFADGPGAAAGEEPQHWLASWWRYQGP